MPPPPGLVNERRSLWAGRSHRLTVEELGSLEILVNNAAYQETEQELEDFTTDVFDRIFKTNVYAPFWLCRAAMKHLPPGGSIINTVSIQGYNPSPMLLPYAATKSALIGMTKALAKLGIEHGIRVNAVAPGPVWTPFIPTSMPKEKFEKFGAIRCLGVLLSQPSWLPCMFGSPVHKPVSLRLKSTAAKVD